MMKIKLVFLVAIFLASPAHAGWCSESVTVCNNCTMQQMRMAAESKSPADGIGHVLVLDFVNEIAKKIYVRVGQNNHGEPTYDTFETGISDSDQHDAELIFKYRKELIKTLKQAVEKNVEDFPSAPTSKIETNEAYLYVANYNLKGNPYDFIRGSFRQVDFYDAYFSGYKNLPVRLLSSVLNKINIPSISAMNVEITITFYSGANSGVYEGTAKVIFTNGGDDIKVISAKDSDKNRIPMSKSDINGQTFRFHDAGTKAAFDGYIKTRFSGGGSGGTNCHVTSTKVKGNEYSYNFTC